MKDFITPEMIEKCIQITKDAKYNDDKYTCDVSAYSSCRVLFPDIIELALVILKRQARLQPLEIFVETFDNPKQTSEEQF